MYIHTYIYIDHLSFHLSIYLSICIYHSILHPQTLPIPIPNLHAPFRRIYKRAEGKCRVHPG